MKLTAPPFCLPDLALVFMATALLVTPTSARAASQEPSNAIAKTSAHEGYAEQDFLKYSVNLVLDPSVDLLQGSCEYTVQAVGESLAFARLHALYSEGYQVEFFDAAGEPLQRLPVRVARP